MNVLQREKINNLQTDKDIKLELRNLIKSSSDEESKLDIEQVYQH